MKTLRIPFLAVGHALSFLGDCIVAVGHDARVLCASSKEELLVKMDKVAADLEKAKNVAAQNTAAHGERYFKSVRFRAIEKMLWVPFYPKYRKELMEKNPNARRRADIDQWLERMRNHIRPFLA